MITDLNTATNAELKAECERLENEYKKLQIEVSDGLKQLYEYSKRYVNIKKILNKREGKTND